MTDVIVDPNEPVPAPPVRRTDGQDGSGPILPSTAAGPNAALAEPTPAAEEGVDPRHPCKGVVTIVDADRGIVRETMPDGVTPRKKFAICGFASSSRDQVPVNDPEWSIWGLNQLYRHIKRADRWFDIHWNWDQETVPGTDYRGWVRDCGIPFYMTKRHPDLPTSVRYPLERIASRLTDYFTSSIAFMLALAIDTIDEQVANTLMAEEFASPKALLERRAELYADHCIGIFGVDLVVGTEYFHEKPCAEFWIGTAAIGRGIRVHIPQESALVRASHRYGYESEPESVIKMSEVKKHIAAIAKQREEHLKQLYIHDGALQSDEYWQQLLELRLRGATIRL